MAANLENRVPFLDHELVELGLSLPLEQKINENDEKVLLKKIASAFLPRELIYRKKCGFAQPIARWLRNPHGLGAYLSLIGTASCLSGVFHAPQIDALRDEHVQGTREHTETLWTLINLEIWARIFIEGAEPARLWDTVRNVCTPTA